MRHGGKSGALPGLSSGRRSQPDPRTLRGVVLARWGEGNGPHAGRVGYSEGAVWDGFSGERTTAKGTGRGKGTRYRIRQPVGSAAFGRIGAETGKRAESACNRF